MFTELSAREAQWQAFLDRWPLSALTTMTLDDYSNGTNDAFVYWLEFVTKDLGSMRGGGAFKFGIYRRKGAIKERRAYFMHDDVYSWYARYGTGTAAEAYAKVHAEIVRCAAAAARGDLAAIDDIDLGDVYKWKLAFLYQGTPRQVIPVYKKIYLQAALGPERPRLPYSALYRALLDGHRDDSVFAVGDDVWARGGRALANELSQEAALAFFQNDPARFEPIEEPRKYAAGFRTVSGRQIALIRDTAKVGLFFSAGAWIDGVRDQLDAVKAYAPGKSRDSNVAAHAPELAEGHAAWKVDVGTLDALIAVCDAYDDAESTDDAAPPALPVAIRSASAPADIALNRILCGPPGTGKTFNTVDAALDILDRAFLHAHADDRRALKTRFDALADEGRIDFVTFHQSFSYEDFVEGLRAETGPDGALRYRVAAGVFKTLCDAAAADPGRRPHVLIIDEINRGNVARIFGELITLIEPSKRAGRDEVLAVTLPYSKTPFSVPANLYLIGTMNTADRSLANLDVALRRRFSFHDMPPQPSALAGIEVAGLALDALLAVLNQRITALLDRDHCIGHTYFLPLRDVRGDPLAALAAIFRRQIVPLLQEYFFEDWQHIRWVLNDHRKAPGHQFVVEAEDSLHDLFGADVPAAGARTRWQLNDDAFGLLASYTGILRAAQ